MDSHHHVVLLFLFEVVLGFLNLGHQLRMGGAPAVEVCITLFDVVELFIMPCSKPGREGWKSVIPLKYFHGDLGLLGFTLAPGR